MSEPVKKTKKLFVQGPVSPAFIAESIAKHSSKTEIGAHNIFLGQVRRDRIGDKEVRAIEYSAYEPLAEAEYHDLRESVFAKYPITCMHVYHSLGTVNAGEISLFVFVSAPHRKEAFEACREMVELLKAKLPVWGKELFADEGYVWKENR